MTTCEYIEQSECPACAALNTDCASILGTLGRLIWIRCRFCGMQYNIRTEAGQAVELVYPIQ